MATINSYLNFNGNTMEAFDFYRSVFGGEFTTLQRFKDVPGADKMPEEEKEKIMHIALPIGANLLMGSDVPSHYDKAIQGTNFSISAAAGSEAEATRIFNELSQGGHITMPLDKMFWDALFGMITDKFSIQWMVNYDYKQPIGQ